MAASMPQSTARAILLALGLLHAPLVLPHDVGETRPPDYWLPKSRDRERDREKDKDMDHHRGCDSERRRDRERDGHQRHCSGSRGRDRRSRSRSRSRSKRVSGFNAPPPQAASTFPVIPTSSIAGSSFTRMFPNMLPPFGVCVGVGGQLNPLVIQPQAMTQQATRNARCVYVGGLPPSANEQLRSQELTKQVMYKEVISVRKEMTVVVLTSPMGYIYSTREEINSPGTSSSHKRWSSSRTTGNSSSSETESAIAKVVNDLVHEINFEIEHEREVQKIKVAELKAQREIIAEIERFRQRAILTTQKEMITQRKEMVSRKKAKIREEIQYCQKLVRDTGVAEALDEFIVGCELFREESYRTVFLGMQTDQGRISWLRKKGQEMRKKKQEM